MLTGFGHMTSELKTLAEGKLVLALEGGYHLASISDCAEMCVRALLGDKVTARPCDVIMSAAHV